MPLIPNESLDSQPFHSKWWEQHWLSLFRLPFDSWVICSSKFDTFAEFHEKTRTALRKTAKAQGSAILGHQGHIWYFLCAICPLYRYHRRCAGSNSRAKLQGVASYASLSPLDKFCPKPSLRKGPRHASFMRWSQPSKCRSWLALILDPLFRPNKEEGQK